jgi:hypothetical protein
MHFIDFALVNSWIEYRKDCVSNGIPKKEELDLLSFLNALILMRVAESLINLGKPIQKTKRGRPSSSASPVIQERGEKRPAEEIQNDQTDHLPLIDDSKEATRCKNPGCKGRTHFYCHKCKVHLCLVKNRNCFVTFYRK